MKTKHLLLLSAMLLFTMLTATAQDATNQRLSSKDDIPFGKKMPPPDVRAVPGTFSSRCLTLMSEIFLNPVHNMPILKR